MADDPTVVARFLQERNLLVNLRSPHVIRVHDLVVEGPRHLHAALDAVKRLQSRQGGTDIRTQRFAGDDDTRLAALHRSGRIVIEIRRASEADAGWSLEVTIADNGRGMSAQELALAQGGAGPGGKAARERRTGLGIPLARQLIAAHDGTLEIASRKSAGTTATIRLP